MSVVELTSPVLDALAQYEAAQDELYGQCLDWCSDGEIVEVLRRVETSRRRAAVFDHALIGQLDTRQLAFGNGCKTLRQFLRLALRIRPGEAKARIDAAGSMGARQAQTGQRLEPIYPAVAAAQADGAISPQHAQIIVKTIERLPDAVRADYDRFCETTLVDIARDTDPDALAQQARILAYRLDQDGQYREAAERHKAP